MDTYIQFIGAVLVLLIIPGPDMAYCMACGMSKGVKGAFFAASGIGVGGLILTIATTLIVYFSDSLNPHIFTYIQLFGCIYLLYLGVKILMSKADTNSDSEKTRQEFQNIFFRGIITNVSNPKALVFFLSFLPQFVPANSSNIVLTIFTLGVLLCAIGSTLNFVFGVSGISLHGVAKKTFLDRSIDQYVTALIFISVALLFLSSFAMR